MSEHELPAKTVRTAEPIKTGPLVELAGELAIPVEELERLVAIRGFPKKSGAGAWDPAEVGRFIARVGGPKRIYL